MSYILDALRRADAERERDPARGIHAQPAAVLPSRGGRAIPRWAWSAGAGVLAIAAAAAWWTAQRPAPRMPAVVGLVTAQPAAPVPAAVQPPAVAVVQPTVVPVASAVSPPAPAPLPPVEKPIARPVTVAAVPAKAVPAAVAPAAVATPAVAATVPATAPAVAAPATAATPAAPAADRILAFGELPADVQRELPKLAISGGVHSENASQRLLIVGGQVITEGAEVAPGVTLEQIRARAAVLRYRGYKYSVPF